MICFLFLQPPATLSRALRIIWFLVFDVRTLPFKHFHLNGASFSILLGYLPSFVFIFISSRSIVLARSLFNTIALEIILRAFSKFKLLDYWTSNFRSNRFSKVDNGNGAFDLIKTDVVVWYFDRGSIIMPSALKGSLTRRPVCLPLSLLKVASEFAFSSLSFLPTAKRLL